MTINEISMLVLNSGAGFDIGGEIPLGAPYRARCPIAAGPVSSRGTTPLAYLFVYERLPLYEHCDRG